MNIFFDSSAWAKRYIEEEGSRTVEELCFEAEQITLSILCIPEVVSAFSRLMREEKISKKQFKQLKGHLFREIKDLQLVQITEDVIQNAVTLLQTYPLRTLDALHIACALSVKIDLFVTADRKQMEAARALNLAISEV